MLKKSLIGIAGILVLVVIVTVGINKYIESTTTIEYGQLPGDNIPDLYEKITYTIPTVDEEGNENSQTFTIDKGEETSRLVKLAVRNNKVKDHEFIGEKDVPDQVMAHMPEEHF